MSERPENFYLRSHNIAEDEQGKLADSREKTLRAGFGGDSFLPSYTPILGSIEMDYSKEFVAQLTDKQLQAEWEKYLAYSYERQKLRGLVQSVLRKKSPARAVNVQELAEGGIATAKSGDKEILLAKVDGKIYAIDNACGHLAYPLNEGRLDGHVVTCRWHLARFDVRTGKVVSAGIDFENLKPLEVQVSPDGSLAVGEKP